MAIEGLLFPNSKILQAGNPVGYWINKKMAPSQPKLAPQRLGEMSTQTAKEGEDRPRVYGIGRPIGGNIMYMSQPIKKMVKTYVGEAGGKGGGSKKKKQYQDVEHVYRYYAVGVCEGPITGFRRIWRNGALVYDARKGSAWGAKNNHLFFKNYRLYTGSWDQMPDSMLQSRWGMDIPAHRGTAYLVADNEDLTDFGGAIPQWQFEVVRSEGFYLTSRPYSLESGESVGLVGVGAGIRNSKVFIDTDDGIESLGLSGEATSINVRALVYDYNDQPDNVELSANASRVYIQNVVTPYNVDDPESIDLSARAVRVFINETVIDYRVDEPESINLSARAVRVFINEN